MKLNNKVYDLLKWVLTLVVPATITLNSTLGSAYGWDVTTINLTIGAFATFFGAIFMISSTSYKE